MGVLTALIVLEFSAQLNNFKVWHKSNMENIPFGMDWVIAKGDAMDFS